MLISKIIKKMKNNHIFQTTYFLSKKINKLIKDIWYNYKINSKWYRIQNNNKKNNKIIGYDYNMLFFFKNIKWKLILLCNMIEVRNIIKIWNQPNLNIKK